MWTRAHFQLNTAKRVYVKGIYGKKCDFVSLSMTQKNFYLDLYLYSSNGKQSLGYRCVAY